MNKYEKPSIEVLLFDEEDNITTSGLRTLGYTATQANTYQMGSDANIGGGSTVHISTVKVTELDLDGN